MLVLRSGLPGTHVHVSTAGALSRPPTSALGRRISSIATRFATEILAAVARHGIEDVVALHKEMAAQVATRQQAGGRSGRGARAAAPSAPAGRVQVRRSDESIAEMARSLAILLARHPGGLRAEELRKQSGFDRKDLHVPLAHALRAGLVGKKGEKRRTVYFAKAKAKIVGLLRTASRA